MFWSEICLGPTKYGSPKNVGPKILSPKTFKVRHNAGSEILLCPSLKNIGSEKCLGLQNCWVQQNLSQTNLGLKKI